MKKNARGLYQKQITITVDGKKKQKCFYGKTIAEINQKLLDYKGETNKGRTFKAVAEEWWEEIQHTLEFNTVQKGYASSYKDAVNYFEQDYIKDITARDIDSYIVKLVKKKLSFKTINAKLQAVRQILAFAMLNGELEYNVALAIKLPKNLPRNERDMPSATDIERIKNSHGNTFSLFALIALYTGCRRGEILALTYEDVDYQEKQINIDKSVYFVGNKPLIKKPKTEKGKRKVPLLEPLERILDTTIKSGYIFNDNGEMLTDKAARKRWEKYCKETDIEITPHQLRHAYATRLYELNIDEKSAQEIMGHADIQTMRNIYTHISDAKRKTTAEQLKGF